MSITPTAMQCLAGRCGDGAQRLSRRRTLLPADLCVWTAATLTPCAGWRIFTASSRQKSRSVYRLALPASGAALMISNAACKTTVWHSRQRHWKTGKWAQAAALQRQRLALDPGSVWITYRLSQDLWQAGQRSRADTLMRNLAQQKPNDRAGLRLRAVPLRS